MVSEPDMVDRLARAGVIGRCSLKSFEKRQESNLRHPSYEFGALSRLSYVCGYVDGSRTHDPRNLGPLLYLTELQHTVQSHWFSLGIREWQSQPHRVSNNSARKGLIHQDHEGGIIRNR